MAKKRNDPTDEEVFGSLSSSYKDEQSSDVLSYSSVEPDFNEELELELLDDNFDDLDGCDYADLKRFAIRGVD